MQGVTGTESGMQHCLEVSWNGGMLLGCVGVWKREECLLFAVAAGTQRCRVAAATAMHCLYAGTSRLPSGQTTPCKRRRCQASQKLVIGYDGQIVGTNCN